ncbi:MAG: MaoC family dehydratase [Bryobacteraceae bacterium]|jgi:acyl dehydratase
MSWCNRALALSGVEMSYGRYFEELEPGKCFRHWPGRTLTEFDDTLFSLMSMNQHPLHIDEHYAAGTQHGRRLVAGPLVISLVIGISQADIGGRALETLDYSHVRHLGPVFHGDTIYAESTVVLKEELPNERGLVVVSTRGLNQREEAILTLERKIVVPKRPAGESL